MVQFWTFCAGTLQTLQPCITKPVYKKIMIIEWIEMCMAFGWLSGRSSEKNFTPENFLKKLFWSFCPLTDKTNNKHFTKPFLRSYENLSIRPISMPNDYPIIQQF